MVLNIFKQNQIVYNYPDTVKLNFHSAAMIY